MNNSEGECPHCGKEFDHLPAHKWQCPEKPDESEENDVKESETDDSDEIDQDLDTVESDPGNDIDQSNESDDETDSNAGVIVDQVKPQEKDTRKNPDQESETDQEKDSEDEWVELDYNSGKQVKTILETTDLSELRQAQKLLKAFKTGQKDDIPKFDEIRLSDGELR